jgi:hypothetical protein
VGERGMRGNGDLSIPFAIADCSDGRKVPYVLESAGKVVFVDNPKISSKDLSDISRSLLNYILEADELQLSELLLWLKRCRARAAKGSVLFKSILRRNKRGGIKASLLSNAYKQSHSAIRAMSRRVREDRYRERLKVYYEVYLDLFFNYTYFVYEDKIKRLMSGTLTNAKRAEIGCFGKLFDRITSDLKSISDCDDKTKKQARCASKRVFSIDTHDKAYDILKELDTSNSTIIHFDAHKDLWNLSNMVINDSRFGINSANYLSAVMRDRLCKKLMLVFPDGGDSGGEGPQIRKEHFIWEQFYYFPMLLKCKKEYPMYVEGREVIATDLFNLPESIHDVILDIDFDYFICNPLAIREPWIGIDEFIDTLKEKDIDVRAVIFSYSIKDGYVCKRFKEYGNRIVRKLNALLN